MHQIEIQQVTDGLRQQIEKAANQEMDQIVKGLINLLRTIALTNQNLSDNIFTNQLLEAEIEKKNVVQSGHVLVEHESNGDC